MARGTRRFWWSLGFAIGFVIRDLMEDESCVRSGLRKLLQDARTFFGPACCPSTGPAPSEHDAPPTATPTD